MLGAADLADFLALAATDPTANVFVDPRARATMLDPRWLGGEVWGLFRDGDLVAACHAGANLVPVCCTPAQARIFAERARSRRRVTATVVGPQEAVLAMWEVLAPSWGPVRERRFNQPHLVLSGAPQVAGDPHVRRSRPEDLDNLYPACVAMYTEEVGISPEPGGNSDFYRSRVRQLIARGWSFAHYDAAGGVVFKAEVAAASPQVAQIQGVWVHPDRRGEGVATAGMAAVAEIVLREIAPTVSLYVNSFNAPARAAYARVGFVQSGEFATIMF